MSPTKESSKKELAKLVERFREQHDSYKRSDYSEALVRKDFIDPMFRLLGWDMDNSQGFAEAYREVIHEDKVRIGGALKAPDYSFRLPGGKRLFFVEAKKPFVKVKSEVEPAYQVRRYAWNAKLPVSILTDFEELSVYDCTKRPEPKDGAAMARMKYLTFEQYIPEFDFLWDTFSKEQVLKGSFDRYLKSDQHKRGTTTVDAEFLKSLDEWRTYLATSISLRNKKLDEEGINFVVQQTIDRLIFLRMAEDRGVEPYGQLKAILKEKGDHYPKLFDLFQHADRRYNSGLFDFKKDKLSEALIVDNKVVQRIVEELYYPKSPYEFSVISVEILGSAYEQFLGKRITIGSGHRARIEEKPEVRHAGGVYYTPQYIVEYIVERTVGELVKGKRPEEIAAMRFVDPACGSGSFLLGTYQYLLNWHKEQYGALKKLAKGKKSDKLRPDGELTTAEKKRILVNNIYGVDLDANAVEVTKLSLLLKCMEGETHASIEQQLGLFHERVLPTLDKNVQCGNSLIDVDAFDLLPEEETHALRPFSWQRAFPEVFKKGGFDAVLGNPPYVRQELLTQQKPYYQEHFAVYHGVADLYTYFMERAGTLLKPGGLYGIIVANKWMRANYGEPLRRWLKQQDIRELIDFGDLPVFQGATTYPCIVLYAKGKPSRSFNVCEVKTLDFERLGDYVKANTRKLDQGGLDDSGWSLASVAEQKLYKKLMGMGTPLGEYVGGKIYRGVLTGLNEAFVIDADTRRSLIKADKRSAELIKPFLAGRDIKRYQSPTTDKYLIFTRRGIDIDRYPAIKAHLGAFKKQLMPKPKDHKGDWGGRKPGPYKWYEAQDTVAYYEEFDKPKIMWAEIALRGQFVLEPGSLYLDTTAFFIPSNELWLLGVLNSKLFSFLFAQFSSSIRGGFFRWKRVYMDRMPIMLDKKLSAEIAAKVKLLIQVNQDRSTANGARANTLADRAAHLDTKIDALVYQLYGLSEAEVKVVEGR
ncbi:MAG: Eco57I restriction-modification methylase domain-containing protein [Flavobacteriales bacterium]|nr:Eco57I restriction-modification methylase domain-containing protein [Flavobacteriales bacterium]